VARLMRHKETKELITMKYIERGPISLIKCVAGKLRKNWKICSLEHINMHLFHIWICSREKEKKKELLSY
jgi:hypothetical protein